MLHSRRRFWAFGVFSLVFITFLLLLNAFVSVGETAEAMAGAVDVSDRGVVIIDAGHGDFDPGCVAGDGT